MWISDWYILSYPTYLRIFCIWIADWSAALIFTLASSISKGSRFARLLSSYVKYVYIVKTRCIYNIHTHTHANTCILLKLDAYITLVPSYLTHVSILYFHIWYWFYYSCQTTWIESSIASGCLLSEYQIGLFVQQHNTNGFHISYLM